MNLISRTTAITFLLTVIAVSSFAQTTEFSYQGSLQSSSAPANGNFDFEFALFDSLTGGLQLGTTLTRSSVTVANGTFAVKLDFGSQFPGANRFLEIRVRQTGGGAFTPLTPRQSVGSSPYSVQSLNATNATTANTATNATQLGGVAANQYVVTTDPRMIDARPPTAGSSDYIQNQNAAPQVSTNFNISGSGTAGGTLSGFFVNAMNQFKLNGARILAAPPLGNLFVGQSAGQSASSFATNNAFFGTSAGAATGNGSFNSFFGHSSGISNTDGNDNSFFGFEAGNDNTSGTDNSFFGRNAGRNNSTGTGNVLIGRSTGLNNTTGTGNTIVGSFAGVGNVNHTNATAIGFRAFVTQNNSLVLGAINGINGSTADTDVGIGTTAPSERLHVAVNGTGMLVGGAGCPSGNVGIGLNGAFGSCTNYTVRGDAQNVYINRPTGGDVLFRENNGSTQLRLRSGGVLQLVTLGTAGATALCRNASNDISTCSSSARYKDNINTFASGLDLIRRLRPVSFNWKDGGMADMGLVAEEVAEVEPLLTSTNAKGEVEGVKYDRVGVVLVNAVKEQQAQIEAQQKQIETLERQNRAQQEQIEGFSRRAAEIDELKALVCSQQPSAAICKR